MCLPGSARPGPARRLTIFHAGEKDLDVGPGDDCGFEGSGFFFNGEADQIERRKRHPEESTTDEHRWAVIV